MHKPAGRSWLLSLAIGALALAGTGAGCDEGSPDEPVAPNMQPVLDAFATPTATLDPTSAGQMGGRLGGALSIVDSLAHLDLVSKGILGPAVNGDMGTSADSASDGKGDATSPVQASGYLRVDHICRGTGATQVADPKNGSLSLTVEFTEAGLDPVVWGDFVACRERIANHDVVFDGALRVFIGHSLQFNHLGQSAILFDLRAHLNIDGKTAGTGELIFQVCPPQGTNCSPGVVEVYLPLPGSEHLNFVVPADRRSIAIRAANGYWSCHFATEGCTTVCDKSGGPTVQVANFCLGQP